MNIADQLHATYYMWNVGSLNNLCRLVYNFLKKQAVLAVWGCTYCIHVLVVSFNPVATHQ